MASVVPLGGSRSRVYWLRPRRPRRAGGRPDLRVAGLETGVEAVGVSGADCAGAFGVGFVGEVVSGGSESTNLISKWSKVRGIEELSYLRLCDGQICL